MSSMSDTARSICRDYGCPPIFNYKYGSSSVERFYKNMPPVYSICGGGPFMSCNYFAASYINGGWNNGLMTFSDIIADRDKTTWWSSFSAGIKEQLYLNPIGTVGTGIMVAGAGLGILGNLANALANFGQTQAGNQQKQLLS